MAPLTASSISASSNTIKGALPPSSSDTFLMVLALCAINNRPISVDPVKLTFLTVGLVVISSPIWEAEPVITENTPLGTPASSASTARAKAEYGVWEAGLTTMGQPAANAAAALRVIMALGKFQGVIAAHTPTGSRVITIRWLGILVGITSP